MKQIKKYSDTIIENNLYKFIIRNNPDGTGNVFLPKNIEDDYGCEGTDLIEIAEWKLPPDMSKFVNCSCQFDPSIYKSRRDLAEALRAVAEELDPV